MIRPRLVCGIDLWNGMTMFGRGLLFGILIPIRIIISLRRGISISLKKMRRIAILFQKIWEDKKMSEE
jgi:hypothetical protein